MNKIIQGVRGLAMLGLLALAGVLAGASGGGEALAESPAHKSHLRIAFDAPLPITRRVRVGLNKSMVVELPRDLRDVVVSNPEKLDAVVQTTNRVYLIGKETGQANAFFFDNDGRRVLTLEVTIERDGRFLQDLLNRLIPGAAIKVEMINETVVLTGTVPRPIDANRASDIASRFIVSPTATPNRRDTKKVINMLAVEGNQQVLLKVTVAEMKREMVKRLGVNWNGGGSGQALGNWATNNRFPVTSTLGTNSFITGVFGPDKQNCTLPGAITNVNITPAVALADCLAGTLEAFERNGLVRILAEPTLTAISGETASFLAGGEFPVPIAQDNNTITVDWKPFGVGLSFTPLVMSEGRISMKVATEVSELTSEGSVQLTSVALPGLKVRRANTTVELPSGGSLVIAGLLSDDTRQNLDGVPGLKRLPILGTLFRSRDYQKKETELVVIVTPYMVNPVARSKLKRPDDNFMPETELTATLLGRFNRIYEKADLPAGSYKDDIGFIVE